MFSKRSYRKSDRIATERTLTPPYSYRRNFLSGSTQKLPIDYYRSSNRIVTGGFVSETGSCILAVPCISGDRVLVLLKYSRCTLMSLNFQNLKPSLLYSPNSTSVNIITGPPELSYRLTRVNALASLLPREVVRCRGSNRTMPIFHYNL